MPTTLKDLVIFFRSQEDRYLIGAVQVISDSAAQRTLATWATMPVEWKIPKQKQPKIENERALWDWAWQGILYDANELAKRAGVDRFVIEGIMARLVSARLVYPDGTISGTASGVLRAEVFRATAARLPKPKGDKGKKEETRVGKAKK